MGLWMMGTGRDGFGSDGDGRGWVSVSQLVPTKSTVAPSFHRQVIVVFVCVPASLPSACLLPGERLAACSC